MEAMREAWTDDRLDDLADRMDRGFNRVAKDVRELRAEMNAGFDRVDRRFESLEADIDARFNRVDARFEKLEARFESRIDNRFDALNARFDAMQRTMLQVGGGVVGALLVVSASLTIAHF